jgi:CRP/FNR family transcriptional regulator, cyclic AMP receptor protein
VNTPPEPERSLCPGSLHIPPGAGKTVATYAANQTVFSQGDPADSVFHIEKGKVKLTVVSPRGKEATIAILGAGDFFGEGCLLGRPLRTTTAAAMSAASVMRLEKSGMRRVMEEEQAFATMFLQYLLNRNLRIEEDLVDHLFNSCERRLARVLLLLADFSHESEWAPVVPKINQETLASIVGTTRSRVSFFMNRFRKLDFIEYKDGLVVHRALLTFLSQPD